MNRQKNRTLTNRIATTLWTLALTAILLLPATSVLALGTPAGTTISNTATANYNVGGNPAPPVSSAPASFNVVEIINATAAWQDSAPVAVASPDTARVLTYLITNTGNGSETFRLTTDDTVGGDQFNPVVTAIWLESGAQIGLQTSGANQDTSYAAGVNDPNLAADGTVVVYVVSDIPAGRIDADTGFVQLTAAATTAGAAGAAAGTVLAGGEVVGATNADGAVNGTYIISTVTVSLTKAVQATVDPFGGNQPVPGAVVTYRITVNVTGSGTAQALVITDPIPVDMTYAAGSIVLDAAAQTDGVDGDAGDYNVTNANTVTVNLGDTAAPATHVIDFNATINN